MGTLPIPDQVSEVVWHSGLDVNPLDTNDLADVK